MFNIDKSLKSILGNKNSSKIFKDIRLNKASPNKFLNKNELMLRKYHFGQQTIEQDPGRDKRRIPDQKAKERKNQYFRNRYAEDPEYRARKLAKANDPEYRARQLAKAKKERAAWNALSDKKQSEMLISKSLELLKDQEEKLTPEQEELNEKLRHAAKLKKARRVLSDRGLLKHMTPQEYLDRHEEEEDPSNDNYSKNLSFKPTYKGWKLHKLVPGTVIWIKKGVYPANYTQYGYMGMEIAPVKYGNPSRDTFHLQYITGIYFPEDNSYTTEHSGWRIAKNKMYKRIQERLGTRLDPEIVKVFEGEYFKRGLVDENSSRDIIYY